jgi:hyaluronan synthase
VYQSTSLVYTDAPLKLKKLVKQQFRWARGSQYNTLRMTPWMLGHAPLLAFFFLTDIFLPFLWLAATASWFVRMLRHHDGANLYSGMLHSHGAGVTIIGIIALTVLSSTLSMSLRQLRHLTEKPNDLLWMPLFILFSTVMLMPIRIYGFVRLGHVGGWGTRAGAHTARPIESRPLEAVGVGERRTASAGTPADRREEPPDGDPRGLLPYLIASAILTIGVFYDAFH